MPATVTDRTTAEVTRSIRRSISETDTSLGLAIAGIATQIHDGVCWRLTDWGEPRYGAAFRALPSWLSGEPV